MSKVFAFIGSPLKGTSNTATLTRMLFTILTEQDPTIECELITGGEVKISDCKGCWQCMIKGSCPLDDQDDMGLLKQKMLEADFIIWGSPLYTEHVSGQTKTFLDRLAAWYHTIRLAGKPGMTVATSAGGNPDTIHHYLAMLLSVAGVKVLTKIDAIGYFPGMLFEDATLHSRLQQAASDIYPYLTGEKRLESDENMDKWFQAMKFKVISGKEYLPADYNYWESRGMLDLDSYAGLLART